MRLALRELLRQPGRFVTATVVLTLVATLIMLLGGLLDGLVSRSTGALRVQSGDAISYSVTARASLLRSQIDPDLYAAIAGISGVEDIGGFSIVQLGGRLEGAPNRELISVVLFGYELPPKGFPEPPPVGSVLADRSLQADGVDIGTILELGPNRTPVEVVDFVDDTNYAGQGALWGDLDTWREVAGENAVGPPLEADRVQAVVVAFSDGADPAAMPAEIDAATDGATETLSISDAIDAIPGVAEQRTTFNQIIGVTAMIAAAVIGLFFALLTVERLDLYGVLKALGAKSSTLFLGIVTQAVVVTVIAGSIAAAAVYTLDALIGPGGVPLTISMTRVWSSMGLLLAASLLGCSLSLRRVLRVDPAAAIGTAG